MSISFIFKFNKDLTVKFAPPFLVMTSSYEAVMSQSFNVLAKAVSRGRSTSAPELSSSVALAPLSKGVGTSEELMEHMRLKCKLDTFSSGRRLQTKPNQLSVYRIARFDKGC